MTKTFYHPELDVLRFVAFLLVFRSHAAGQLVGGGYGVDLFFALSSYLITELLLREHKQQGNINVGAFYTRRVLRIWPLYFVFLLLVRPIVDGLTGGHFAGFLLPFLLLSGNWACLAGWPASVAAPLWSVSIEEQFYLFWPLLMRKWIRYLPQFCIGLIVLSNLVRVGSVLLHFSHTQIWCNTFARLDPIAGGALLALWKRSDKEKVNWMQIIFAFAIIMSAGWWGDASWHALLTYPVVAIASVVIINASLVKMGSWRPGRLGKVFVYLGRISYGLYVFHVAGIAIAGKFHLRYSETTLLALLLTILASAISYELLEKPFLAMKKKFTTVPSRPVSANA